MHHCSGAGCCPRGAMSLESRLVAGMKEHIFPRLPGAPIASKWTTLSPAVNAIGIPILLRVWKSLWGHAFSSLKCATEADTEVHQGDDAAGVIDWASLTGQRYLKSLKFVNDEEANIGVILLMICLEATRWITDWFIMCASDKVRAEQPPRILDALLPPMSRLTRVLQYMAKLYFDDFNEASMGLVADCMDGLRVRGRASSERPEKLAAAAGSTQGDHGICLEETCERAQRVPLEIAAVG